jgi:hypothetical protein
VRLPSWQLPHNRFLYVAVLVSLVLVAALVYVPFVQEAAGTVALRPWEAVLVAVLALGPSVLTEAAKRIGRGG